MNVHTADCLTTTNPLLPCTCDGAYRGYLIRATRHGVMISKGGFHIATCNGVHEARAAVDELVSIS